MITSVQSLTRIGERLPNGAVLIDRTWTRSEEWGSGVAHEAIVLALIPKGDRHEYVTWVYCLDPRQFGEFTVSGHYFDGIDDAVLDYRVRTRHNLVRTHFVTEGRFQPRIKQ